MDSVLSNGKKTHNSNIPNKNDTPEISTTTVPIDYEWRTIIFIRHGNSVWNEASDHSLVNPLNAAKTLGALSKGIREYANLRWRSEEYKHEESIIVDTPLSTAGMQQSYDLSRFLASHLLIRDEQKLHFLQEHQLISSPIKDAWRCLKQYQYECQQTIQSPNALCMEALNSLTIAMMRMESLMANAKPINLKNASNENTPSASLNTNMDEYEKDINIMDDVQTIVQFSNDVHMDISAILDIVVGKNIPSIIVTSNLRRAISTCVLSLWPRLRCTSEKVYIVSCLQEIGINVDTLTHTPEFSVPTVSNFELMSESLDSKTLNNFYAERLETIYNYGSKSQDILESSNDVNQRIELFAQWLFSPKDIQSNGNHNVNNVNIDDILSSSSSEMDCDSNLFQFKEEQIFNMEYNPSVIIAVGHSTWLKLFFKTYLPTDFDFVGKHSKLANCGMIAFKFYWNKTHHKYGIAPDTLTVIHKGFGDQ